MILLNTLIEGVKVSEIIKNDSGSVFIISHKTEIRKK